MQDEQLKNSDLEDVNDVLKQIETSFGINFGTNELQHIKTFGELCDIVESKIHLFNATTCTSQQAFYKLRKALKVYTESSCITSASLLSDLLPARRRKLIWRSVEHQLGFKLDIMGMSSTVSTALVLAFLASLLAFFIDKKVAIISLVAWGLCTNFAAKTGNTLQVQTIQECVEKMTREQYIKSRRNPATFNQQEIFQQVQQLFIKGLYLPASALGRDATFA
ncbi:hypothetical protein [Hymenobacter convexus]|uniref:hypothetical protein n=1 Tax=Hymenobacter sp. CA1UV-4 TaxID=3063782 RepID=UPI002713A61B|nr:hypothetical protein [Hymenobacter sp. CA1UV-4]MDO7852637.1 hypothetical protein [Hymenobacter sp. CA1UV-4]